MLAILINDLELTGINNETIMLQKDTVIVVDYAEGIACSGDHCFDIFDYEYRVLN